MGIADWLGLGKTVAEVTDKATNGVANIITTAKGDIPPEAKGRIEELKVQIAGDIEKIVENSVNQARDFALKYEGTAEQIPRWLLVVRALIRPVITIYMFGVFVTASAIDIINLPKTGDLSILKSLPQEYYILFGIVLGFWFGGKVGEHIVEKIKKPA